jgi:predicted dinucleotide-binding enzyme
MKLISQSDLGGFGNGGEGLALQAAADGRRIMYVAHESGP